MPPLSTSPYDPTGYGLPAGVTIVEEDQEAAEILPSPSGRLLVVLADSSGYGDGSPMEDREPRVVTPDGRRVAAFHAANVAWLGDDRLTVLGPLTQLVGSVTVRGTDGTVLESIPGAYASLLSSGRMAVLVAADGSFRVWADGRLGPKRRASGTPVNLSRDGSTLALMTPAEDEEYACTGCYFPDMETLSFMRLSDGRVVKSAPDDAVDANFGLGSFSPDGRYYAVDGAVFDTAAATVLEPPHGWFLDWTPDGTSVLADSDGAPWLWRPGDATSTRVDDGIPHYGGTTNDVLFEQTDLAFPMPAVVVAHGSRRIVLGGRIGAVAWASDGVCYVQMEQPAWLLRVDLTR